MTALIIICGLILFFALILSFNLRAEIKYYNEKLSIEVKYLFIKFYPLKERTKKERRHKVKKRKNKQVDDYVENTINIDDSNSNKDDEVINLNDDDKELLGANNKKKEKKKLSEKYDDIIKKIDIVKLIWNSSEKGLKKIFKCIHLNGLIIDFVISDEDAYEAAMKYGKISALTYNLISIIRLLFPISIKTVDILCDFDKKKSVFDGEITIKMRVSKLISGGLCILWGIFKNWKEITGEDFIKKQKNKKSTSDAVNA